jgi:hypothetical protein
MVEPLDADPDTAVAHARRSGRSLTGIAVRAGAPWRRHRVLGGQSARHPAWTRHPDGLEDTPVLPDGRLADGNGDLVAAAAAMLADSAPE